MSELGATIVIATLVVLVLCVSAVLLLVVNSNHRVRHRAELQQLKLERDREVVAVEREAQRQTLQEVGRELHDNVGQLLAVARLGLYRHLAGTDADGRLAEVMRTMEQGIEEVRRLGRSLNSDMWEDRSFEEAIRQEAERIERAGIGCMELRIEDTWPELPTESKTILFRVFQEVVNNALRHSGTTVIHVALSGTPTASLTIADKGQGFDPALLAPGANGAAPGTGSGLLNVRRRCALIGFNAVLDTAPAQGCTWTIKQDMQHGN
jgi:two-component system NarL family sensor kinase